MRPIPSVTSFTRCTIIKDGGHQCRTESDRDYRLKALEEEKSLVAIATLM
jgi:hypothetical protein